MRQHIYDSARTIQNEGLYPEYLGFKLFQMDDYTDTLMLFEAASADELPPLQAMMTNTAYNVDNFETLADDLAWYIEKAIGPPAPSVPMPPRWSRSPTRGTGTGISSGCGLCCC